MACLAATRALLVLTMVVISSLIDCCWLVLSFLLMLITESIDSNAERINSSSGGSFPLLSLPLGCLTVSFVQTEQLLHAEISKLTRF